MTFPSSLRETFDVFNLEFVLCPLAVEYWEASNGREFKRWACLYIFGVRVARWRRGAQ